MNTSRINHISQGRATAAAVVFAVILLGSYYAGQACYKTIDGTRCAPADVPIARQDCGGILHSPTLNVNYKEIEYGESGNLYPDWTVETVTEHTWAGYWDSDEEVCVSEEVYSRSLDITCTIWSVSGDSCAFGCY